MSRMLRRYLEAQADTVEAVLIAHRAPGRITGGTIGPRLIRFTLDPAPQTRLADVRGLAEDLAIALKVSSLWVERTHEGIILEFPNPEPRPVTLASLWPEVQPLPPATALLGLTDDGAPLMARLSSPEVAHILVAGTIGAGKTALLRTMAVSLALSNRPDELRLLCIDLQGRAFRALTGIPHLVRSPVATGAEAVEALQSLVRLMELRLSRQEHAPRTVIYIDEATELVCDYPGRVSVESLLVRLAQSGHLAGIHLVVATRRPSAAMLSDVLRANFPLRLVGKVVSAEDAQVAARRAQTDAHLLNGRGDFLAVGGNTAPIRFQIAYIGDQEARQILSEQQQAAATPLSVTSPSFTPATAYSGGR